MRARILIVVVAVAALAGLAVTLAAGREEPRAAAPAAAETPRPAASAGTAVRSAYGDVRALAAIARRNGRTRAAGTAGDRATADYIAQRLTAAGYRVRRQTFTVPVFDERRPPRLRTNGSGTVVPRTLEFSAAGRVTARLRPVAPGDPDGGCTAADFAALRRGEIAVVPRGTCTLRAKALGAQRAGAAAVVIVNADDETFPGTLQRPGVRIPVVGVASTARAALDDGTATLDVDVDSGNRRTANVIAERGSGRRVVMAGAHLDSVPAGPGMNDNASGVAALLESAERLSARVPRGATLRFGFWGAEELGLIGSRRYVDSLERAERRAIAAYLNLDMVASPRPTPEVYDTDDRIERVLRDQLPDAGESDPGGSSDHAAFERADIPVGGLFTGASRRADQCYHRACDDLSNVDRGALATMTRAARGALADLL